MDRPDASLRVFTGYRLRRTTSSAMAYLQTVLAEFGLRRTTYSTLSVVVAKPGQRQGQVAAALAIERPNFVQIVDELEKEGLILRERATDDRRAYALHATPRGQQLFAKANIAVRRYEDMLTKRLTPQQLDDFHRVLDVIASNASKGGSEDDV